MSKTTLFATCGLVGALISSVVAEALYALLPSSEPPPVHVAFVLDNSSSMTSLIEGLKGGITSFVNSFEPKGLKAKVGLIAFSDTYSGEPPIQLNFNGAAYTADTALFSRTMQSEVKLRDGGDGPETGLSALVQAAAMPTDEGADKVIVLITDAPAKLPDNGYASSADAAAALAPLGVTQINFVVDPLSSREYTGLRGKIEGSTVEIGPAAEGGFQLALPKIGEDIANRIANLQGTGGVRKKDTGILFVIVALASGVVASGIAVWLIGAGLSTFVPNLHRERGALGGAIGGAVGAVLFRLSSEAVQAVAGQTPLADALGRILGWSFLGLCIGVAIVAIEQAFREAWVKVHYGPHESRVVGLGAKDVTFGSDRERCTVYVPG
ncbi:VWA domain-containing protein, partial [bacterium]